MRIRAPANVFLHRAQVILILSALVPTILTTPLGIILLATGYTSVVNVVLGVLVLAFAASSVTGFIIGGIFLRRGSALVNMQHDFLSAVSHELRTPMTSMRMFIEALLDDRLTDVAERARCLELLHQEIGRLDGLVGRLIELSRLESGGQPFERQPLLLREIVDEAVAAFKASQFGGDTGLLVEVELGLQIIGDKAAMVQVLVNLLSNAWKYTGEDRRIECKVSAAGEREVEIVISDNGLGIPPEERRRVFEKFWRGRSAAESGSPGSGLGLSIVHAIVKAHRGRIEIESPPEGGTSFHVAVPRHRVR